MSDFAKFDRPGQLHVAFQALDKFQSTVGRLPRPYNKEDALKFVEIAKETNSSSPCKVGSVLKIPVTCRTCNVVVVFAEDSVADWDSHYYGLL